VSHWFAYTGGETPTAYRGLDRPVAPIYWFHLVGEQEALPCSRETRCTFALLSDPGQTLALALMCCRHGSCFNNSKNSIIKYYEALSHGFCTRCLRFVQVSLPTTQDSLPADGQSLPDRIEYLLGFFERFQRTTLSPFHGLRMAR
jgi:hypothetical protein